MSPQKARSQAKLQEQLQIRALPNRRMTLKHHLYTAKQCRLQKYCALVKQQGSTPLASMIRRHSSRITSESNPCPRDSCYKSSFLWPLLLRCGALEYHWLTAGLWCPYQC
jgi:hypothetical protein